MAKRPLPVAREVPDDRHGQGAQGGQVLPQRAVFAQGDQQQREGRRIQGEPDEREEHEDEVLTNNRVTALVPERPDLVQEERVHARDHESDRVGAEDWCVDEKQRIEDREEDRHVQAPDDRVLHELTDDLVAMKSSVDV